MVLDGPVLALSDIMHGIAVGSDTLITPEDDTERNVAAESSTPEPLDNAQIELMRSRVLELIVSGASKMNTSSREKELLEMVIRLTSAHTPDVGQLCTQANTIQELCRQRDFIIKEVEEERARWEAERLGFDRVAEALIARRSHGGESTYREEELERHVATLDADNKALRQKLSEYHVRVQSVEAELAQLRPVLLMQPYTLTHSLPPAHNHYLHSSPHKPDTTRRVKRRKQGDVDPDATEEEPDNTAMASSSTPRARPRGDYYRRRDTEPFVDNSRHRRRTQKKGSAILADARAEHVLLAARKIGRERASILAGSVTATGRDRDKDPKMDNDQTDTLPRTPRRHQTVGVGNGSSTGVIYLNSPIPATADTASLEQVSSDFSPAQTPLTSRKSVRSQGRAAHLNPLTPLDSLLTAASTISMIEEDDEDGDHEDDNVGPDPKPVVSSKPSTRQMAAPGLGSPVPTKRRRVASSKPARSLTRAVGASDVKSTSERSERTRSALDVLADQAAVFSSQDHDGAGNDKGKGKGKAKTSETGSPTMRSDETPMVGELAGQKPHPRDQAPQIRPQAPQAVPHQPSTSSPTRAVTVTARGHDPTPPLTSETEPPPPSPKNVSLSAHPPFADASQDDGRDVLSASSPRTDNCADKEKT